MNPIQTIRYAINTYCPEALDALAALAELERTHFTSEDVADASAQGFRDGVASVTAGQEPVVWQILNGVCHAGIRSSESLAKEAAAGMQKNHDLGGSLAAFHVRPLYTAAPVAQQQPQLVECRYGAGGYACCEGAPCAADIHNDKVAQQPQARPDFTDEWTGYLKDGETPFERFLRERKDVQSALKLYQRALEENEQLKAQQAQAEAVPPTHVLVPVDEPTDEMVDAACAAVDGLCRVDFVRAYVAAFAHLKAGYRDESYWCGWNAAIKFQQAESAHQYNLANRLRVHLANRHTLTGPEFKDGVAAILAEYYAAPQQAEAVPAGYVLVPVDVLKAASESLGSLVSDQGWTTLDMQAMDNIDAAIAAQGAKT